MNYKKKTPFLFPSLATVLSTAPWYKRAYRGFYNLWAPLYDPFVRLLFISFGGEWRFRKDNLRAIKIKPTDKVLDLCCGTGTLTLMLKHNNRDSVVVGVDSSIGQLRQAKRKDKEMKWLVGDATSLPFKSMGFDKCIIFGALHEMFKEEREKTLGEVYRVLKAKGEGLVCEPNMPERMLPRVGFILFERLTLEYYTCMDMLKSGLINELKQRGFKIKEHKRLFNDWQIILIEK